MALELAGIETGVTRQANCRVSATSVVQRDHQPRERFSQTAVVITAKSARRKVFGLATTDVRLA
ncbi:MULTISPECIES: hypothetical protein [unclassified Streptomyces]|uniref:hypothetical protein n=1 Tax=unclassified Streptomyces TaxID=2593676 RepID=UPI00119E9976|nr:hypothetical protein [Streptomyces sp. BK340]